MPALRSLIKGRAYILASTVLLGQALFYYTGSAKELNPPIAPLDRFPFAVQSWNSNGNMPMDQVIVNALQPDDYLARNYITPGDNHVINLFVGYFNSRRNGRGPHSPEWCLPGAGWKSVTSRTISIPIPNESRRLPATEYLIQKGSSQELVLYWYHQGTRAVASDVGAQVYSLPDLLMHGRTDTALVRVIVPVKDDNLAAARSVGVSFAQSVYPLVRQHLNTPLAGSSRPSNKSENPG